jgi:glycerol-3-phosphate cytidylyltransferase
MKRIVTFGTFDLLHIGHIRLLKKAKELVPNSILIVGISSDKLNFEKKNHYPIYSQEERNEIISSLKYVHSTFIEESLEEKVNYLKEYKADILVMGNDWEGKFDFCKNEIPNLEVIYLPRTNLISTTEIIYKIRD